VSRRVTERLPSIVLVSIAAAYVWVSYDYEGGSQRLPWIAGVLAIVLALIDMLSEDSNERAPKRRDGAHEIHAPGREAIMFGWIGGFLVLVVVLGFYGAIPLYVFCYLRIYARKPSLISAATAFGVTGFLYLVFGMLMGYEIFGGLFAGDVL
jgi:hypothetical protein